MDFATTLNVIRSWSIDDRIRLVQAVCDQIVEEDPSLELTDEEAQEIDRRVADDEAHPERGIPWEVIRDAARARANR